MSLVENPVDQEIRETIPNTFGRLDPHLNQILEELEVDVKTARKVRRFRLSILERGTTTHYFNILPNIPEVKEKFAHCSGHISEFSICENDTFITRDVVASLLRQVARRNNVTILTDADDPQGLKEFIDETDGVRRTRYQYAMTL